MKSYADTVDEILQAPRSAGLQRVLGGTSIESLRADVAELEAYILANAPPGARLDRLLDVVHLRILGLYHDQASFLRQKATYEYPKYRNVLTEKVAEASAVYERAKRWLGERCKSKKPPTPSAQLAELVVSMFLDFQVLDPEMLLPLVESLAEKRFVSLDKKNLTGIPVLMRRGNTDQERFVSVAEDRARGLRRMLKKQAVQGWLQAVITSCAQEPKHLFEVIESEIQSRGGANVFGLADLIEGSSQIAITHIPTSVLAVRTGLTTSHALKLSALERIGGFKGLRPFLASAEPDDDEDDGEENDGKDDEDESSATAPGWMTDLKAAVKKTGCDEELLKAMAKVSLTTPGSWMGKYVLSLLGRKRRASTIYRYTFLIANRLMLRLEGRDPADIELDEWEELVEQILDEDAYFHRRSYSGQGERNAAGYSLPLVKSLRSFATFVHAGKKGTSPLASLLPRGGLVHVDANFITVDEYRKALDWFASHHADPFQTYFNSACRAALILGFRLGLRRAEAAFLRCCDFDVPLEGEDFRTANLHLHVRQWLMRKLKTSNAERDLPLTPLVPKEELEELLNFVRDTRTAAGDRGLLFHQKFKRTKGMKFDRIVEALHEAFRGSKGAEFPVPEFHFHMLRHSAANFWLLKLWPNLHAVARGVFENHPLTLAWIGAPEASFRVSLFGNDAIRGADMAAIALLLGHGSGATTVEHYFHVLEWYREKQKKF